MDNPFGEVRPPGALSRVGTASGGGLGVIIQIFVNILLAAGAVYALFNLILAGYAFLSAGSDSKKIEAAWAKIWQTALGLTFMAGAFVLAAIFGKLIFGNFDALLKPVIPVI